MTNCLIRQSTDAIQPWDQQSSKIPNRFLRGANLSKTLIKRKNMYIPNQKLLLGTKSIYFIKNNQDDSFEMFKSKKMFHKTQQNSPQLTSKKCLDNKNQLGDGSIMIKTTKTLKRCTKKQQLPTQNKQFVLKAKQTMIEFKMTKKLKTLSEGYFNGQKTNNKDNASNLLKIYEKSTFYNENIKDTRPLIRLGISSTRDKFKIQTQQSQNQNELNTFLGKQQQVKDNNNQLLKQKSRVNTTQNRYSQSRTRNTLQNHEKVNLQLLLERKLFLLKNNKDKQYKIRQSINKRSSSLVKK